MRRYLFGVLCLLPMWADAAIQYTPGPWKLYRNGNLQSPQYDSAAACDAGMRTKAVTGSQKPKFTCSQDTTAKVVAGPPPPPPGPVDCVVSPFSEWAGGAWSACSDGMQSRVETRTRTIVTPAANGGLACPPLSETRTVTQSCTIDPPPPPRGEFPPINPNDPADAPLLKFGETAMRNWNFEGHNVTSAFNEGYGKWDLNASTYEPWLFDRASVAYIMWKRTGDTRWLTEFNLLFTFYRTHIDSGGIFTPKGQDDTKYSYVRPFYYYELETGDQQYRPIAKRIHDRWVAELPNNYSPSIALWTEREVGLALDAAIYYHKLTGDAAALNRARALVAHYGTVAASSGAPLHTLEQHGEEFGNNYASMKMTSSWMAALYFQALHEYYRVTGDQEALRQVSRYADFADQYGIVDGSAFHPEFTGVKVPYYLYGIGTFYDRETPSEADMVHCLDVSGLFKFAIEAKQALGQPTAAAQTRYTQMRSCAVRAFQNWTRSTDYLPKYRLTPPRQWNWWVRGSVE